MKLLEGNVFTCVCSQGGCHVTTTHDALDRTVQASLGATSGGGY